MKKILVLSFLVAAFLVPVLAVRAVDPATNPFGYIDTSGAIQAVQPVTATTIPDKIIQLVNWFAWFIALASVVMGLYAGFLFITARGEPAQLKTARQTLFWAVTGIAVAIISFSIITITMAFLV